MIFFHSNLIQQQNSRIFFLGGAAGGPELYYSVFVILLDYPFLLMVRMDVHPRLGHSLFHAF
jgi:hypothetical protein